MSTNVGDLVVGKVYSGVPHKRTTADGLTRREFHKGASLVGLPVYVEHQKRLGQVGMVNEGAIDPASGDAWVAIELDLTQLPGVLAKANLESGFWRHLSLAHSISPIDQSRVFHEVSLVREGGRPNCTILSNVSISQRRPPLAKGTSTVHWYKGFASALVQKSKFPGGTESETGTTVVYAATSAAIMADATPAMAVDTPAPPPAPDPSVSADTTPPSKEESKTIINPATSGPGDEKAGDAPPTSVEAPAEEKGEGEGDVDMEGGDPLPMVTPEALNALQTRAVALAEHVKTMDARLHELTKENGELKSAQDTDRKQWAGIVAEQLAALADTGAMSTDAVAQQQLDLAKAAPIALQAMSRGLVQASMRMMPRHVPEASSVVGTKRRRVVSSSELLSTDVIERALNAAASGSASWLSRTAPGAPLGGIVEKSARSAGRDATPSAGDVEVAKEIAFKRAEAEARPGSMLCGQSMPGTYAGMQKLFKQLR
jgi:hypothetical protein